MDWWCVFGFCQYHPPFLSAWTCSPSVNLMKRVVGEKLHFILMRRSRDKSERWSEEEGAFKKDLLLNLIVSIDVHKPEKKTYLNIYKYSYGIQILTILIWNYNVSFAYSPHVCIGFPYGLWVLSIDVGRLWIALRCECEGKVCVLGRPVTRLECIPVSCQVTAAVDLRLTTLDKE